MPITLTTTRSSPTAYASNKGDGDRICVPGDLDIAIVVPIGDPRREARFRRLDIFANFVQLCRKAIYLPTRQKAIESG
jgi:hypothetical protein